MSCILRESLRVCAGWGMQSCKPLHSELFSLGDGTRQTPQSMRLLNGADRSVSSFHPGSALLCSPLQSLWGFLCLLSQGCLSQTEFSLPFPTDLPSTPHRPHGKPFPVLASCCSALSQLLGYFLHSILKRRHGVSSLCWGSQQIFQMMDKEHG